jgi:hypothetical protein
MKAITTLFIAVVQAGLASAEAPKSDKPAATEMAAAEVKQWLAFFDKLVSTVAKADASCDKLATDVSGLIDQNKPAIDVARTARASGKKLPEAAQRHMLAGVRKMVPAMQKCGQHEKVRAAFGKLDLNKRS